jgi:hypothetical protein
MRKFHRVVLISLIILAVLITSSNSISAEPIKIKGFHIGMSIDDALKNFERLGFEGLSIRENQYKKTNKYYSIRPGSGDQFRVETGLNVRLVSKIAFSSGISNRLFHTKGIGAEIFQKSFAEAYGIVDMKAFKENPGADPIKGWEHYNLKDGYRIRIFLSKDVEIIKTDKESDFAFD